MANAFADDAKHCSRCQRWHGGGLCDWNSESPCPSCRLPLGYKGDDAQGDECFWCWSGFVRLVCDGPGEVREKGEEPEWLAELANLGAG